MDLVPGLYEELVTVALDRGLSRVPGDRRVVQGPVDEAESPAVLADHVARVLARRLAALTPEEQRDLCNRLVDLLGLSAQRDDEVAPPTARHLLAIATEEAPGVFALASPTQRPEIPLSRSDLLVNARGEPSLMHVVGRELPSSDGVDVLMAFVKFNGLRLLIEPLRAALRRGCPVRLLTTTYLGATDQRALDQLAEAGAEIKVSYETQSTRLHAKAWLFRRRTGFDTAYVGSSNLSRAALLDGLEWNVRLSRVDSPALLDKITGTFQAYWEAPDFEPYDPARDGDRLADALAHAGGERGLGLQVDVTGLQVRPYPFQEGILYDLQVEREEHGRWRSLVVAATGTGKTVIAALDYRRLCDQFGNDLSLLFIAHRQEILTQSRWTYRQVLADGAFGELYVGGDRPSRWRHVFASVQSLSALGPERLDPDAFDVVVIDEFHHAAAPTYRALIDRLRPRVLLGLTATPERTDGTTVAAFFDGRISSEMRLWEALERELLCPFHYFGVADDTDLSALRWQRGGYALDDLDRVYTGNDRRVELVLRSLLSRVADVSRMRALGYCVSVEHAKFMAKRFTEAGVPAECVHAATPSDLRAEALRALRDGTVKALFAVDLFNEGLDVPGIDTVLFLRPTESATVFLQQLGRGLRRAPGKSCLTVLDFIGRQHTRFRFDLRLRALTGLSRAALPTAVRAGFPFLPAGCHMDLDPVATDIVLRNVRSQVGVTKPALAADVRSYGQVSLGGYLRHSGRELGDIYRNGGSWTALRRAAGLPAPPAGPAEEALLRRLSRLAHADDRERLDSYRRLLAGPAPPGIDELTPREQRLASMLIFTFWPAGGGHASHDACFTDLWRHPAVRAEVDELLGLAAEDTRHVTLPLPGAFETCPLALHARYSREEILAGLGAASFDRPPSHDREGVRWVAQHNADVLTFALHKSERDYSPTTMYRDYAISPSMVHWESQSTTSVDSPTGQRYIHHFERGTHVLLFAREDRQYELGPRPFFFLGPASYVSDQGSRPISFVWRLHTPMPADFFHAAALAA